MSRRPFALLLLPVWSLVLSCLGLPVTGPAQNSTAAAPSTAPASTPSSSAWEKWEKEIAAMEREDALHPPPKRGVVFVGSSSIRLWKTLAKDFPGHHILNRGFGGSFLSDTAHFAERLVLVHQPRFIVIYAGGNDLNAKRTPEQVLEAFSDFVGKVRAIQPNTPIAFISIAGNPQRWMQVTDVIRANALIEAYTKTQPNLLFVDVFHPMLGVDGKPRPEIFSSDNLHMNAEGYRLWTQILTPYLPPPDKTAP